jgi:hypothetical protein
MFQVWGLLVFTVIQIETIITLAFIEGLLALFIFRGFVTGNSHLRLLCLVNAFEL